MSGDRADLLIVGGGPAALAAARSYRTVDHDGRVGFITDERRMPYVRPALSKELLRGEHDEREIVLESDGWLQEERVELISGRAVAIDAEARQVRLSGGRAIGYEQCLLAVGAEPTRIPVPGGEDPGVRTLRSLDDHRELQGRLTGAARVIVVGSGFIGCEIAVSLRSLGHQVEIVSTEEAPNVGRLGAEAAGRIRDWLVQAGVSLTMGAEVERIDRHGDVLTVTASGHSVSGELVVLATGVTPRGELAEQAGLEMEDGAVRTDAAMRASRAGLLAAGDVCLADNAAAGRPIRIEHWGDAITQGEVAGQTAAGVAARWDSAPGFWSTIGERTLKYKGWGDGFDAIRLETRDGGGFVAWYGANGRVVGVLSHDDDEAYERGGRLVVEGAPWD